MWRVIDRVMEAAAALCLAASAFIIFANVLYRYVVLGWMRRFAEHADWFAPISNYLELLFLPAAAAAGEFPGYLLIWISFLGAFLAQRQDLHIRFEGATDMLPVAVQKPLRIAVQGMLIVMFAMLFFQSVRMIGVDGTTEIESAEIAQGWFMLVLPVVAIMLIAEIARSMLDDIRNS